MSHRLMGLVVVVLISVQVLSVTSAYATPATLRPNTPKSIVSSGTENFGILLGDRNGGTRLEDFGILLGDRKGTNDVKDFGILLGDRKAGNGVEALGILLGDRGVLGSK